VEHLEIKEDFSITPNLAMAGIRKYKETQNWDFTLYIYSTAAERIYILTLATFILFFLQQLNTLC
jgi:hypothetical protein